MSPSPLARLLWRPFRGYEELANAAADEAPTLREGVLRLLFVVGSVVAITATGRLAPAELFVAMGSFAYVPVIQFVAVAGVVRIVSPETPLRRAFAFYLAGHGPWLAVLTVIAALCLITPSPGPVLLRAVPPLVLCTFVWSFVLTYACFSRGLGIPRLRAGIASVLQLTFLTSLVVSYYLAMGQLGPQITR